MKKTEIFEGRKKHIVTFLLFLSLGLCHTYAQSDEVLAKSYFLKAQEAYSEGSNTTALAQLDKTLEYLGTTNPKVEALYVKIAMNKKDYENAEKHLNSYFEVTDEDHSDYVEMLGYVAEVKEKIAEKKAEEAEYKSKRKQKIYNEVVAYFQNNSQLCCSDYLERETLNIDWSSAKRALQSVVVKDMYGSSIKNDTLFQTASNINIPLSDFKNMEFEVNEKKYTTTTVAHSKLTVKSMYGAKVDMYMDGRLNPSFINKVKKSLIEVAQQKRIIKYLREYPDEFPEKSQLLNLQSYLFAYGDRKEYDEDFPEGKKDKTESNINDSATQKETQYEYMSEAQNALNKIKEENWSRLSQNGYTINYPKKWTMNKTNVQNAEFVLTSLDRYGRSGNAAIRMESGAVSDDESLSSYATTYINGFLKVNFSSVKILKNETQKLNNYTFRKIKSSFKTNENLEIMILAHIIIHEGKLYLISFVSKVDEFNEYRPTVEKILSSFTLL